MSEDYYATLGVSRSASAEQIQKAYRDLARKHHPDLNPDDTKSKEKFQEVQNAFDVLNDPQKREMYDRYGSSFESFGQGSPGNQSWSTGGTGGPQMDINLEDLFGGGGFGGGGFADLFKSFGQRGRQGTRRETPQPGRNIEHELTVPFTTAVLGGDAQISVQRADGQIETIQAKIPAGILSGKKIRLRGQGEPSRNGGPNGDLLIKVHVAPHPHFRRNGNRLDVRVPVTLSEAVAGAKIDLPTPHGTITLSIPPGSSSGSKLRVKGHGVKSPQGQSGDLFAEIMIVLPSDLTDEDRQQLHDVSKQYSHDPRVDLQW